MKLLRVLSSKDLDEINEFLGELKDGDLYKARLGKLEDLKAKINEDIEVYGKAREIGRLNTDAIIREEASKKLLDEALADRDATAEEIEKSKAMSERWVAGRHREANERFNEREQVLEEGEANLDGREKAHARSLDDLAQREAEVAKDMKLAVAIRTQYREAVASLKVFIEDTAKGL